MNQSECKDPYFDRLYTNSLEKITPFALWNIIAYYAKLMVIFGKFPALFWTLISLPVRLNEIHYRMQLVSSQGAGEYEGPRVPASLFFYVNNTSLPGALGFLTCHLLVLDVFVLDPLEALLPQFTASTLVAELPLPWACRPLSPVCPRPPSYQHKYDQPPQVRLLRLPDTASTTTQVATSTTTPFASHHKHNYTSCQPPQARSPPCVSEQARPLSC